MCPWGLNLAASASEAEAIAVGQQKSDLSFIKDTHLYKDDELFFKMDSIFFFTLPVSMGH